MQIYALHRDGYFIAASKALRKTDYLCPECKDVVRLRDGEQRQPHFFHLNPPSSCKQNHKSLEHIQLQHHLLHTIGSEAVELEKPFPLINRIADACWEKERIIFEIQCSPMKRGEMVRRTYDYLSQGYQTVWILHEKNYNQWKMTALEDEITGIPHYYSNFNASGEGIIYDQWQWTASAKRIKVLPPLPIEIDKPIRINHSQPRLSIFTSARASKWRLHFSGDLLDLETQGKSRYLNDMMTFERELSLPKKSALSLAKEAYDRLLMALIQPYLKPDKERQ